MSAPISVAVFFFFSLELFPGSGRLGYSFLQFSAAKGFLTCGTMHTVPLPRDQVNLLLEEKTIPKIPATWSLCSWKMNHIFAFLSSQRGEIPTHGNTKQNCLLKRLISNSKQIMNYWYYLLVWLLISLMNIRDITVNLFTVVYKQVVYLYAVYYFSPEFTLSERVI